MTVVRRHPVRLPLFAVFAALAAAAGVAHAASAAPASITASAAQAAQPPERVDQALAALREASRKSASDVLIVWRDGRILAEDYGAFAPDARYETMSATKGVVALAVGLMLQEGKLKSLDQPVADFFPEWRQGRKAAITVRHLLTHTSGLQNVPTTDKEIYPSPDFVQLALTAELSDAPGERWAYNNKATNLIPGLVKRATGMSIEAYMKTRLFDAIGLKEFDWVKDSAGNPHGMSGFQIGGRELLKLGVFVLNRGRVGERQLIAPEFFDELAKPDALNQMQFSGHLWWRIAEHTEFIIDDELIARLRARGVSAGFVDAIAGIRGVYLDEPDLPFEQTAYAQALRKALGANYEQRVKDEMRGKTSFPKLGQRNLLGIAARGSHGQELAVLPGQNLIVVRLVAPFKDGFDERTGAFPDMEALILRLALACRAEDGARAAAAVGAR